MSPYFPELNNHWEQSQWHGTIAHQVPLHQNLHPYTDMHVIPQDRYAPSPPSGNSGDCPSGSSNSSIIGYDTIWPSHGGVSTWKTDTDSVAPFPAHDSLGQSPHTAASTPASDTRYQKSHACAGCGRLFDRSTRARDHAYKDHNQTPYHCRGQCGVPAWYVRSRDLIHHTHSLIAAAMRHGRTRISWSTLVLARFNVQTGMCRPLRQVCVSNSLQPTHHYQKEYC